jgi:hypothetical protein
VELAEERSRFHAPSVAAARTGRGKEAVNEQGKSGEV